ncbi:hypothetical protein FKM82_007688 [Ascaphus truei]|uniref:uncharacterized protein C20orf202 homolog n=1 Tax=Ascaphus truei TaxID=8439 RepID=UPI003F59D542
MPLGPALAWLRRELSQMRLQDQSLLAQLRDLHARIQEFKLESAYWECPGPSQEPCEVRGRSTSQDLGVSAPKEGAATCALQDLSRRNSAP